MDGAVEQPVTVRRQYDRSETKPSLAVLEAVADIKNVRPADLSERVETTLYESVDTDAIDQLLTAESAATVSFEYAGYQVRIDSQELVIVPRESARDDFSR